MGLKLIFLLVTRAVPLLGLSRRESWWKDAEIPMLGPPARCGYVCGPTPFVEAVAGALVGLGHQPQHIKTERFGPTGS